MRRKLQHIGLIILMAVLPSFSLFAQKQEMQARLHTLQETLELENALAELRVQAYLDKNNVPRSFISEEGVSFFLDDVGPDGHPVYIQTFNLGAAATVGTTSLRTGGGLGVNLTGLGLNIGVWEVFGVNQEHVEFDTRVRTEDAASSIDDHATHVAGTIIASGVNPNAQGMAYEARALLFTASNDLSEMTNRAKPDQTSLLFSNHSYGVTLGWQFVNNNWKWNGNSSISDTEDYRFGFYDGKARSVDQLAFNAPYYTIVKSAGNDRNDVGDGTRPPDGPYDAIGTWGNAKNILTVGAVNKISSGYTAPEDVVMSSFSSWGPTDDGRIKPDFVAPGVNLLSPIGTDATSYAQMSGTSMSAPTATGSLALIQQLAKNETNNYLRAATLKALIAHTANKPTNHEGPDYRFGWGLLNIEGMAVHIQQRNNNSRILEERTLVNGEAYELVLNPVEGTPITVTIAWTDPAGNVSEASVDPTDLKLVNDLDMRIIDEAGNESMPWILDPANPSRNAQRGDNFRDNVEKIFFTNPEPRKYTLRINHKGSLTNGRQDYSLVVAYTPKAQDERKVLYWIGNDGNWNLGSNWSLSSGGAPANQTPTAADRVVVDENSFDGTGQNVKLEQNSSVYSFTWLEKEANGFSLNGNTLTTGSFIVSSENLNMPGSGSVLITGTEGFTIGSNELPNTGFIFDQMAGIWNLAGQQLTVKNLELIAGQLNLTNTILQTESVVTSGSANKVLRLGGAVVGNLSLIALNGSNLQLISDQVKFLYNGSAPFEFSGNSRVVNGTISSETGTLVFNGQNNRISRVNLGGEVVIQMNNSFDSLSLATGTVLTLAPSNVLTINSWIDVNSTSADPVILQSGSSETSSITFEGNSKFCFGNMTINGVNATGEAKVSVGLTSSVTNAVGWYEQTCDDVLFANFTYLYNCVDGLTYFINTSSGNITGYAWDFGDGTTSDTENGYHQYTEEGSYEVSLTVVNGVEVETFIQVVNIGANVPLSNKVVVNNEQLVSEKPASNYQWFRNNLPIEGATDRIYSPGNQGGTYFVVTLSDGCNNISDSVSVEVTGVEDILPTEANSLVIYPVPVKQTLFIHWPETVGQINIQIVDIQGKAVYIRELMNNGQVIEVDLGTLSSGIYWLKLENQKEIVLRKIIK